MSDQPPTVTIVDPDGNPVTVGGATVAEQQQRLADLQASWNRAKARDAFLAQFVGAARNALETNLGIREANAQFFMQLDLFIGGTAPAGTVAQQLAWLYDRTKELAGLVRRAFLDVNVLTQELDGLIHMFGAVLPELDDLLDVGGV